MRRPIQSESTIPDQSDELFNRDEHFGARYLGINVHTLRGYRRRKKGPEYIKLNGFLVRYSLRSLREFMDAAPRGPAKSAGAATGTEKKTDAA